MDLLLFIDKIHGLTCPGDQRLGKNEVDYKKVSYTFRIIQAAEWPRMAIEYEDNWVPCEYSSKGIYLLQRRCLIFRWKRWPIQWMKFIFFPQLLQCLHAQWTHMQNCQGSMYQTAMVVQGESNHGLNLIQLIWILSVFIFSASVPANTTTCGINSPLHF